MGVLKLLVAACIACHVSGQLIRPSHMNIGVYNPDTKHYEKTESHSILGGDDHDLKPHRQHNLGGDDHDLKPHRQHNLGGDDHDLKPHRQHNLGGDDHDLKPHRQHNLGGDDHDLRPHGRPLIGRDDHDLRPHQRQNLGGDDHDKKPHNRPLLGSGDHDYRPHRQNLLGSGDHDYRPHRLNLLGAGDHDYKPHSRPIIGGGDHDKRPHHRQNLGGDDHDMKPHNRPLLGSGDHDYRPHSRPIFGGGDHDKIPHRQNILGGGDHDYVPHMQELGSGDHDRKPHKRVNPVLAFRDFMIKHQKQYSGQDEFKERFSIFRNNLQRIKQLQRSEKGTASYGVTKFADLTEEEFKKLNGFRPELRRPSEIRKVVTDIQDETLPKSFDWRDHNVVTPVKNQGSCGSCWAFSVTGNVEGQYAVKNRELISLSEQELVDCDHVDHGCEGGLPENAYEAIINLGGIETEKEYPYVGRDGKCQMEDADVKIKVNGSLELPSDENKMAIWLVKNSPISVGINANPLQFYQGGVIHPFRFLCNPEALDHGVLIVGYGTHNYPIFNKTLPFWVVKNSWGTTWGEQGYFRMYRGDGTCGINKMATSSVV